MNIPKPGTVAFEMALTATKPSGYHLRSATDRTPRSKVVECPCCKASLVLAPGARYSPDITDLPQDLEEHLMFGGSPRSLSATMAVEDLQYIDTCLPNSDEGEQS